MTLNRKNCGAEVASLIALASKCAKCGKPPLPKAFYLVAICFAVAAALFGPDPFDRVATGSIGCARALFH